ncbi:MAG: PIN domain-containing protein [Verrucomicrobiota bacterium]|nr:PIN domain-containing protein [Verrucomicrobiota bacterium]
MKLLLDANVLLDVALDRAEFVADSKRVLLWCQDQPGSAVIAWHTISNVYYILRGARSDSVARRFILELLQFAEIAGGDSEAVQRALALPMKDFEDALQVIAAVVSHVRWIVTRNAPDFRGSPLPALTPADFVHRVFSP